MLAPVRRTLLRDAAYQAIRDAIINGAIKPGATVSNAALADRLGLSRAPVRDALARLADEGLIETKPQSYTRVTDVDPRDVRDAAVVVRAMHELATRAAVPRLTPDDIDTMRAANRRFDAATRDRDIGAAMAADDDLHDVLVRRCGNKAVAATIERYTPLIRRLEWQRFSQETARRSVALHDALIAACATGDTGQAAYVTREIWQSLVEETT